MPKVRVNLTGAPPMAERLDKISGQVSHNGWYHLRISSLRAEDSSGNHVVDLEDSDNISRFVVRFYTYDAENPNDNEIPIVMYYTCPLTEGASTVGMSLFHDFLLKMGFKINNPEFTLDTDLFIDKTIDAYLINRTQKDGQYAGSVNATVSRYADKRKSTAVKQQPIAASSVQHATHTVEPETPHTNGKTAHVEEEREEQQASSVSDDVDDLFPD